MSESVDTLPEDKRLAGATYLLDEFLKRDASRATQGWHVVEAGQKIAHEAPHPEVENIPTIMLDVIATDADGTFGLACDWTDSPRAYVKLMSTAPTRSQEYAAKTMLTITGLMSATMAMAWIATRLSDAPEATPQKTGSTTLVSPFEDPLFMPSSLDTLQSPHVQDPTAWPSITSYELKKKTP